MFCKTLSANQLAEFRDIQDKFLKTTPLPGRDKWRSMSGDEIWLRMVSQVVVVGKESPARLLGRPDIKARLDFKTLIELPPSKAAKAVGRVLADIGTRYVSYAQPASSPKVRAVLTNLAHLRNISGGPSSLGKDLSRLPTSRERVEYLSKNFSYFGPKGARDFLTTGLGMATDVIALDSRVMGIVGLIVPELRIKVNAKNYVAIEEFLIKSICKPLNISAMEFDQLIFLNEGKIKEHLSVADGRSARSRSAISGSLRCGTSERPIAGQTDCQRRSG